MCHRVGSGDCLPAGTVLVCLSVHRLPSLPELFFGPFFILDVPSRGINQSKRSGNSTQPHKKKKKKKYQQNSPNSRINEMYFNYHRQNNILLFYIWHYAFRHKQKHLRKKLISYLGEDRTKRRIGSLIYRICSYQGYYYSYCESNLFKKLFKEFITLIK